ncbi:ABC transporter ATP-binding protein [Mesorhizobium sp. 1M-11]|uniref:ABC transporter ATP-binding protein n=1 Tax=Mesorhizobium sp. 1M-11 TaxID=1529006 RepID=UPI0006C760F2|nr:ABC transporter ATP-binding protein [Mesorhizobium sp. 1M-11]
MNLLAVSNLSASLGRRRVLSDVSFTIGPSEFVGLIGPNGAGKSTLLKAALGLVASQGGISIAGRDAAMISARERASNIAYVAQEHEIAWAIPVEAVVALGRTPHRPGFAAASSADHAAVEQAMRRMEVDAFRDRAATDLSGGEKARVLIARALAQETPLLLADEPTAGLDPSHQITLMRLFASLTKQGRSVVASLHDLGLAARWCSRLILIDQGRIVADGPPDTVLTVESLGSVYGVDAYFGTAAGRPVIQPLDLIASPTQDKPEDNHDRT